MGGFSLSVFLSFFLKFQPLCGPTRGLLPPPTSLLVAVTRQTFLVVTAGLVELSSSTGIVFKKRASQTRATLNSSAAEERREGLAPASLPGKRARRGDLPGETEARGGSVTPEVAGRPGPTPRGDRATCPSLTSENGGCRRPRHNSPERLHAGLGRPSPLELWTADVQSAARSMPLAPVSARSCHGSPVTSPRWPDNDHGRTVAPRA